ncbi:MAG: type I-B CRISPR-associated protein Cas5b [Candidatus Aenigmatarchaeota archaeon]
MDKVITFEIWGDYAHFKKIETTKSPLTYSIPTGTALSGLIAGIMGYKRDSYYNVFSRDNIEFAVKLEKPVNKIRVNQNLINTANPPYFNLNKDNPRTQIPYEYLSNPRYRVYLGLKDENILDGLTEKLRSHKTVFTPFLGLSEHIANFKYVGEFKPIQREAEKVQIDSVLPKNKVDIDFSEIEEGMRWVVESIPLYMNEERVVKEYAEVIFDSASNTIPLEKADYFAIGESNVIFL